MKAYTSKEYTDDRANQPGWPELSNSPQMKNRNKRLAWNVSTNLQGNQPLASGCDSPRRNRGHHSAISVRHPLTLCSASPDDDTVPWSCLPLHPGPVLTPVFIDITCLSCCILIDLPCLSHYLLIDLICPSCCLFIDLTCLSHYLFIYLT